MGACFAIRGIEAGDEAAWRRLWAGYIDHLGASVPAAVTDHTWARLIAPERALIGRVAESGAGAVIAFSIALLHEGTFAVNPVCYLEDLYVDAAARGQGAGRAMVEDFISLGRANGWSQLYWMTHNDNVRARRVYDRIALADGHVRYRINL